jgi:hypothetical protein
MTVSKNSFFWQKKFMMKMLGLLEVMDPNIHSYSCLVLKQCNRRTFCGNIITGLFMNASGGFIYLQGKTVSSGDDVAVIDKCS